MTLPFLALSALGAVLVSAGLTGAVRRYAVHRSILDIPNERSSHRAPVPRGGGMAIAVVSLGGIGAGAAAGVVPGPVAAAALGGGILVAGVGWADDHGGLSARMRAAAHLAAAVWALWWLGGLTELSIGTATLTLGPAGNVLAALGIVWCINLYNFMDGIDGIAAGEALTAGLAGAVLLLLAGDGGLAAVALSVAAASAGFLVWNWPPARIFMGDVGSGLLGYLFALLALASERAGVLPLLAWALLLGVFLFDATVTLVRRLLRRERVYVAHRRHAYQRAVRAGWPHWRVTATVLGVNALLAALAAAGACYPILLPAGVAVGAALLVWLYVRVERILPIDA